MSQKSNWKAYLIITILMYLLSICFFALYSFEINYLFVSISFSLFLALSFIIVFKYIFLFNYFTKKCRYKIRTYSIIFLILLFLMVGTECVFYFRKAEISWLVRTICMVFSSVETSIMLFLSNKFQNYYYSEYSKEKEQQVIKERLKENNQLFIKKNNIKETLEDNDISKLRKSRKLTINLVICTIIFLSFSFTNLDFTFNNFAIFRYVLLGIVTVLCFYFALSFLYCIISTNINLKLKRTIIFSTISILLIFIADVVLFTIEANALFIAEDSGYYPSFIILLFSTNIILLSTAAVFSMLNISKLLNVQNEINKTT